MLKTRIIVCLLIDSELHLINTKNFLKSKYLGDPLNAAYIFSNYEVDELLVLDVEASNKNKCISFEFVKALSNFTTVPLTVGGGISSLKQIKDLLSYGVERVVIGQNQKSNFTFLRKACERFGSSSISAVLNVKKLANREYQLFMGRNKIRNSDILSEAFSCQKAGAGELIINSMDRDGSQKGLDIDLMKELNEHLSIPLVAMGGCGNCYHIDELLKATPLSGIACSSIFVYAPGTEQLLLRYSEIKKNLIMINP